MKRLAPKEGSAAVDKELIRDLAGLLQETGLAEIEIEHEGFRVRVARPTVAASGVPAASAAPAPAARPEVAAVPAAAPERVAHPGTVKSPMVGTAYLAPAPGAQPFVEIGSDIKKGQTILIIEAMKTMNPIPAPSDGRVIDIMVADGQPVEFGEPLMIIE
jgi:acetyl-CoA carboxylase biotin carboxyl carrier protein